MFDACLWNLSKLFVVVDNLGVPPKSAKFNVFSQTKLSETTMVDEMRVLSLSRPHVPRGDADLPYLLVWVAML